MQLCEKLKLVPEYCLQGISNRKSLLNKISQLSLLFKGSQTILEAVGKGGDEISKASWYSLWKLIKFTVELTFHSWLTPLFSLCVQPTLPQ